MKQYLVIGEKDSQEDGNMETVLCNVNYGSDGGIFLSPTDERWHVRSYNTQGDGDAHQITVIVSRGSVRHFIEFTQKNDDSWGYELGVAADVCELGKVVRKAFVTKGTVVYNGVRLDHLYRHLVIGKRQ